MTSRVFPVLAITLLLLPTLAFAWGPSTEQAVVTTAAHVLTKNGIQLSKLDKDLRDGATASPDVVAALYPGFAADPVHTIQSEMNLLGTVRGKSIDPYFAYRLGALGRLVAGLTAPLLDADKAIRDKYYADAERNMKEAALKPSTRKVVDAGPYFAQARRIADTRKELIIKDYQDGVGFDGIAKATLPEELSHSIDAIADTWNTILTQKAVHASISDDQIRNYITGALAFYSKRNSNGEIDANYKRLTALTKKTPDLAKRIGDIFYDGGQYERAIAEYQDVLAADPQRRDVVTRIAEYYVKQGDDAVKSKRLQEGLDFFAKAAKTDPLHPEAEKRRLETEKMIAERDARLDAAKQSIEEASTLQTTAEQQVLQTKFADAMATLQEAQAAYQTVTDEFPTEARAASIGLASIESRLRELKTELTQNAQGLTGVGFLSDMQRLAASNGATLDEPSLRAIANNSITAEITKLKAEYQDKLSVGPAAAK